MGWINMIVDIMGGGSAILMIIYSSRVWKIATRVVDGFRLGTPAEYLGSD